MTTERDPSFAEAVGYAQAMLDSSGDGFGDGPKRLREARVWGTIFGGVPCPVGSF